MLPSDELTRLQADLLVTLPDTCALLSATTAPDGYGGVTETWGTVSANVACRLDAYRGKEAIAGAALNPYQTFVVTLPADTAITPAHRVLHGGTTYNVVSVSDGSLLGCKRAIVEKV